jgi:hypothetical protein
VRWPRLLATGAVLFALALVGAAGSGGGAAAASATGLSVPVRTPNGFVFSIADFDPTAGYTVTTSDGFGAIDPGGVVTISGLLDGETATATVSDDGSTMSIASAALPRCPQPAISAVSSRADGFAFTITNYASSASYAAHLDDSVPDGARASIDASGVVAVAGLAPGAPATVSISATFVGCVGASRTVTASALPAAESLGESAGQAADDRLMAIGIGNAVTGQSALLFVGQPTTTPSPTDLAPAWWLIVALVMVPIGPLLLSMTRTAPRVPRHGRPVRDSAPR